MRISQDSFFDRLSLNFLRSKLGQRVPEKKGRHNCPIPTSVSSTFGAPRRTFLEEANQVGDLDRFTKAEGLGAALKTVVKLFGEPPAVD